MAVGRYLSFRLPIDLHPDEILVALAESMTSEGYEVDLNARPYDPDWYFLVRAATGITFGVVLVMYGLKDPDDGFILLEGANPELPLSDEIRVSVNPILEKAVSTLPNISMVTWHTDYNSLEELK